MAYAQPRIDEAFQELVAAGRKEDADVAGAVRSAKGGWGPSGNRRKEGGMGRWKVFAGGIDVEI